MKKYRIVVKSQDGHVIFDHSSDSAAKLIKRLGKEGSDETGNIYEGFYFGSHYYYYNGERVDDIFVMDEGEIYIEKDGRYIRIFDE